MVVEPEKLKFVKSGERRAYANPDFYHARQSYCINFFNSNQGFSSVIYRA